MERPCVANCFPPAARAKWARTPFDVVVLAGDGMCLVPSEPVPNLPCHLSKDVPRSHHPGGSPRAAAFASPPSPRASPVPPVKSRKPRRAAGLAGVLGYVPLRATAPGRGGSRAREAAAGSCQGTFRSSWMSPRRRLCYKPVVPIGLGERCWCRWGSP